MLLNYLKLAIRLLIRNPLFTFINVLGLSVGFAVFFGLWQYTRSELISDQYHPFYNRTARIIIDFRWTDDGINHGHNIVGTIGPATMHRIDMDFPEVEAFVRILPQQNFGDNLVGHEGKLILSFKKPDGSNGIFKEAKAIYADPNLFDFFSIPLIHGQSRTVLKNANSVVMSQETAQRYFGDKNPVGELLVLNNEVTLEVTGVYRDLPGNTHLDFDFVISNISKVNQWNNFVWSRVYGYVRLSEKTDFNTFEKKIGTRKNEYWAEVFRAIPQAQADMIVQPLKQVAFSQNYLNDHFKPKSTSMLTILGVVSIIILVMAWVNYINLTLARTVRRMKEVATRKMAGAKSIDFVKQFLIESVLVNLIAIVIALTILQAARVPAEMIFHITPPAWSEMSLQSSLLFLFVIVFGIVVTGLYPAIMSVKYNPKLLFFIASGQRQSGWFPGILTTCQYAAAIVLMLWVIIMYLQLEFIYNKGFGAGIEQIAIIESPMIRSVDYPRKIEYFNDRLKSSQHITDITFSNSITGDSQVGNLEVKKSANSTFVGLDSNGGINENFISFFDIRILAGRNFDLADRADVVLLSRVAITRLGFGNPEDAVGEKVYLRNPPSPDWHEVEIIGVIEDYRTKPYFNFSESSTEYSKEGRGICLTYENYLLPGFTPERLAVKLKTNNLDHGISEIEKLYREIFPGNMLDLYFLDDHINRHYNNEKISRNQVVFFTLLAIAIACLGLLGMVSNKVLEKTKEIGVRKVLGATTWHIFSILLHTTFRQIAISVFIGIPIAHYLIQHYLERFSERVTVQWWYFMIPVIIFITIMFGTIASALWKAVRTNPAESLRYE